MAKDIKLYKDGHEVTINETQLENFLALGYKQEEQTDIDEEEDFEEEELDEDIDEEEEKD